MIAKIKQFITRLLGGNAPEGATVEARLSPELQQEVRALASKLSAEHVSVRDVYEGEEISETPHIEDTPLKTK